MSLMVVMLMLGGGASVAAEQQNALSSQEQSQYLARIRSLYPASNERQALLAHCNQLLETYALRAGYQVGQAQREDLLFQLNAGGPGELLMRKEVRAQGRVEVRNQRISLFGVDPFIRYECPAAGISCEFKNPLDGSPWLTVVRDHSGAAELAKALSFLIRNLQKG